MLEAAGHDFQTGRKQESSLTLKWRNKHAGCQFLSLRQVADCHRQRGGRHVMAINFGMA